MTHYLSIIPTENFEHYSNIKPMNKTNHLCCRSRLSWRSLHSISVYRSMWNITLLGL